MSSSSASARRRSRNAAMSPPSPCRSEASGPLADAAVARLRGESHPGHLPGGKEPAPGLRPERRRVVADKQNFRRRDIRGHAADGLEHIHPHLGHVADFNLTDRTAFARAVEPRAAFMRGDRHMRAERHPVQEGRLLRLTQLLADEWHDIDIAWAAERAAALALEETGEVFAKELLLEAEFRIPILALEKVAGEIVQRDRPVGRSCIWCGRQT